MTQEQARALLPPIRRQLEYLGRLRTRMEVRGFPPGDPLYVSVVKAFEAVHELHVRTH